MSTQESEVKPEPVAHEDAVRKERERLQTARRELTCGELEDARRLISQASYDLLDSGCWSWQPRKRKDPMRILTDLVSDLQPKIALLTLLSNDRF
jgi:hypothetical protein